MRRPGPALAIGIAALTLAACTTATHTSPTATRATSRPATRATAQNASDPPVAPGAKPPTPGQLVSYHGIGVTVPAGLPIVTNLGCGAPQSSEVLLDDHQPINCFANPPTTTPAGVTVVTLTAQLPGKAPPIHPPQDIAGSHAVLRDGTRALAGYDTTGNGVLAVLVVPTSQAVAAVQAPTRAEVDSILASVRTLGTDPNGCRGHVDTLTPANTTTSSVIVPTRPTSATVCEYLVGDYYASFNNWLLHSRRLSQAATTRLAAALDALPAHAPSSRTPRGINALVRFAYADGSNRVVRVVTYSEGLDPSLATDGQRTVDDLSGAVAQLLGS